jgi:pimeloyl-ACP methyl ester carboxylesterase
MADYRNQYPFQSHYFDHAGVRMHYLDEGPTDAPVMVMVHGNPTWSFYYRHLVNAFSDRFRVVVPDHIGCGLSDKPQEYPYTLEQHIQNLEALLKNLDVKDITLVVHDWGGGIGFGYATRHPENVKRMVVFNTSAFFRPVLYWGIKVSRSPIIGDLLTRGLNSFLEGSFLIATSQHKRFRGEVRDGYLAPYRNWHDRIAILRFVQDIPMKASHPTRKTVDEIEARLPLLKDVPKQFIWGVDDPVFTTDTFMAGFQEHFPDANYHTLDNAGHYVVEDAHERIIPVMQQFLE